MRIIYVAAAVGMAVAVLFIAPAVLMGASSAHADSNSYLRCMGSDAEARRVLHGSGRGAFELLRRISILVAPLPK
jgi:hypothetical protein